MKLNQAPLFVGASAGFPFSEELKTRYTFASKFDDDEPIELFRVDGNVIHLPRRLGLPGGLDACENGTSVKFEHRFKARSKEQLDVAKEMIGALRDGRSFILQAPTGFGKTVLGCLAAFGVQKRTLVITTKEDIIQQWVDSAKAILNLDDHEIGVWRADQHPQPHHKIVIGLVHSIAKGYERYPKDFYSGFGLVICDEVHRMGAKSFSQAMWWLPARLRLGLSATPYRKDGREIVFTSHIGEVEVKANLEVMIPKVLVQFSKWRVPRNQSGEPIKHSPGKTMHLNKFMANSAGRNQTIANFLKATTTKGRTTIVFADTMDHLHKIHEACLNAGISHHLIGYYVGLQYYEGKDKKGQREAAKHLPVILATYKMASEATDLPWVDTCVLASPRSDVIQIVGRIRREYPNKKQPVVLDIVDRDSPIFYGYFKKRLKWYKSINCAVKQF